jgi:hypothetical protein
MESPTATPAAPAQPAAPTTVSAEFDAATKGDYAAFKSASDAARAGKPAADVTATPAEPTDKSTAPAQPPLSRKEREQQEANERVRRAVEAATADLRTELAALKAAPRSAEPPKASEPPKPNEPAWKRYAAMADAPKLGNFDSVEEHAAAMALFIADKRHDERTAEARHRADVEALGTVHEKRINGFVSQLQAAKAADKDFQTKLAPEVIALKPFGALKEGEPSGPANIIAEQLFDSPIAPQVMLHLSQHPEELARLQTMPEAIQALPPHLRVRAHMQWIVREFGKLEGIVAAGAAPTQTPSAAHAAAPSTITAAPPPPPSVSNRTGATADPSASAVARGDFASFQRTENQKRLEKARGAASR